MNSNAPYCRPWVTAFLMSIGMLTMMALCSRQLAAQVESRQKTTEGKPQPANPLTDAQQQTQTRAETVPQTPSNQQESKKQIQRPDNPKDPKKKVEIPAPENLILDTDDGVRLKCTYFAPPKTEGAEPKPVLPFILLHDWDGDRRQLLGYASFLQRAGHAAIVPDLRGHGESIEVTGAAKTIDFRKFRKSDVMSAQKDIERCKKFLVQQHNKGDLNVDLLCLVAVGETSVLAVQWTLNDWFAFPAKNPQGIKQGQDVKALMLISPVRKLAGISMIPNLSHPMFSGANGPAMPMLVMWGASEESAKESEAIAEMLEKSRPNVSGIENPSERTEQATFFRVPIEKYRFSGLEMMERERVENLWPYVSNLLFEKKVIAHAKDFPWVSREPKSDEDQE